MEVSFIPQKADGDSLIDVQEQRTIPKPKKPWATLVMNILPLTLIPISIGIVIPYATEGEGLFEQDLGWAALLSSTPTAFIFGSIPAHIYVKDSLLKTLGFTWLKFSAGGFFFLTSYIGGYACGVCEGTDCCDPYTAPIPYFIAGVLISGGIYTYEVIDTYRSAVKYNERLKEEKESSFYLQPIITKKREFFITGGIRF